MAIKLEVFSLARDFLSRFIEGIDLYTSAKFRGFNTNLNNSARCPLHFPVLFIWSYFASNHLAVS